VDDGDLLFSNIHPGHRRELQLRAANFRIRGYCCCDPLVCKSEEVVAWAEQGDHRLCYGEYGQEYEGMIECEMQTSSCFEAQPWKLAN
jgi:hypothetical protein